MRASRTVAVALGLAGVGLIGLSPPGAFTAGWAGIVCLLAAVAVAAWPHPTWDDLETDDAVAPQR